PVPAPRGQERPLRVEGDAADARPGAEDGGLPPGRGVPQAHGAVRTPAGDLPAAGAEGQAVDRAAVAPEVSGPVQPLPGGRVPQPHAPLEVGRGQASAAGLNATPVTVRGWWPGSVTRLVSPCRLRKCHSQRRKVRGPSLSSTSNRPARLDDHSRWARPMLLE